mmetsp:Transcript_2076/g.4273  ORF Transcript_2076/g.4273 Transcript_2076/m.4273 type:complete len:556 (-) Transcript_2076:134-1801(-)
MTAVYANSVTATPIIAGGGSTAEPFTTTMQFDPLKQGQPGISTVENNYHFTTTGGAYSIASPLGIHRRAGAPHGSHSYSAVDSRTDANNPTGDAGGAMFKSSENANGNGRQGSGSVVGFRNRVKRTAGIHGNKRIPPSSHLTVDAAAAEAEHDARARNGEESTTGTSPGSTWSERRDPTTPPGVRGHSDLRSPGAKKTPMAASGAPNTFDEVDDPAAVDDVAIPDFITQTDRHGRATTPRSAEGIQAAREMHPSGPKPHIHVEGGTLVVDEDDSQLGKERGMDCQTEVDACDSLLDSLRMMCCCLMPEDDSGAASEGNIENRSVTSPVGYSTRGHDAPLLLPEDSALRNGNDPNRIKLLPSLHSEDHGKKCLVLDLDETLVHSSFRAVPGADFVIPVQIEDVVHFVYVAKRPGVDEFLAEMAKYYEIVVYTASLNKYADPLLDLLDPNRVIRTRLFRESCVFYEGNYVKDMSLLNRDLSQAIIIDNSPSSYLFHPENAIDCSSFIDDPNDRELDQIGKFLIGIKDVEDVRGTVNLWRHWPNVDLTKNHKRIMSSR